LEENQRRGRRCAALAGRPLATPAEIKVDLIASLFVRRHLPFSETIEGAAKEITWLTMHAVSSTSRAPGKLMGGGIGRNAFAGGSSGGGQIWPGWNRPGNVAAIGADLA
jgi:hypothetical protein